ncbi:MAG TPA: PAS domain S-box protein [Candidatus Sulfotelmatobacter sp.]|nr:PAS domain S-box protein [Candidatus Sulfotelmatobacter sp.]
MRLLLVDDHEVVRRGVRSLLSDQDGWEICGEAVDGQDALEKARDLKPDLIVMDVSMPRLNGLEATRQVRNILPHCEVLVLSQHENSEMARQALKAGARGYVVKSSISRDLISAVTKASRHEYFFDPAILDQTPTAHTDVQEILRRSAAFEQALRQSEQLYRSTFELAAVGVAHVSPEGKWLRVNKKFCEIVGYSEQELLRLTFQDITHPDDLAADLAQTEKVRNGTLHKYSMEKRYIRKNRSHVWVNLSVSGVRDTSGKLQHFISVVEDITARKSAERALRESEERLQLAQQVAKVGTFEWNIKTGVNRWTPELERLYGLPPGGFAGTQSAWQSLVHPDDREETVRAVERALRDEHRGFEGQWRVIWPDGSVHWLLGRAWVMRDQAGEPERLIGVNVDISERKRVEDALHESQNQLVLALDSSKTAMFDWDLVQQRGKWNPQMASIYGFMPSGEYISIEEWKSLFHPDDTPRLAAEAERVWRGRDEEFTFEFRTAPHNGEIRWILSHGRIVRDSDGNAVRMIGTHTDITEAKRTQEALERSESRIRAAFSQSYSFLVLLQPDGTILEVNQAALEAAGATDPSQVIGRKFWEPWWSPLPDEVATLKNLLEKVRAGERIRDECVFCLPDGNRRVGDRTLNPIFDVQGRVAMIVATGLDITDRKQSETAVATRARQQKALFHLADELHRAASMEDVYNAALNAILDALQCNRASILLCDDAGVMHFKSWRGLSNDYRAATDGHSAWRPDDNNPQPVCIADINTADLSESLKAVIRKEGIGALAFIPLVLDGKLTGKFMVYFNTPHRFAPDEIDVSVTIARQLSFAIHRCRVDESLRESNKAAGLLAAIVTSSDDAIVSKDLDGIIKSWNSSAERIFGYSAQEAIGQHITLIIPPDRLAEENAILARIRRAEKIDHFHTVRRRKDGTLIDVSVTISPVCDSSGRVIGASKVARDITAQKRAEQALRESEQRYQTLTDASPVMIWMAGRDKLCYYFNKGWLDFVGRSVEQELGNGWAENVHPDDVDRCLQLYAGNFDAHRPFEMEYRLRHHTGQYRWLFARGIPRYALDGTFEGYVGACLDIHDRKQAAEKMRIADETMRLMKAQDEERRRIAREFHDSAGQTLTVLGLGLAQLVQDAEIVSPELAKAGRQIEEVVQQLHREIRTTSYLLHPPLLDEAGLSSALEWYVQGLAERGRMAIDFDISADFGRLPADMELAIFRVVQECLTNIHRHAESKTATIRIARDNGSVCIEVRDEGKGISPERLVEIESRGSGVGIAGIRERVRHFGGTMKIESDQTGTRVLVSIPLAIVAPSSAGERLPAAV